MTSCTLTTTTTTTTATNANANFDNSTNLPKQPLNYTNIFFICLGHILCVYTLFTFPWLQKMHLALYSVAVGLIAGFGVTAGAHRYFTHSSYKARMPLKILLLVAYAMSGHNTLFDWVRDHRTHHKFVETHADPHNSNRGFFFSHVGWLFMQKHPDVIKKGKTIDMRDMSDDALLVWYNRHFILIKSIFCFIIPTLIPFYLFNEDIYTCVMSQCVARYVILLNITWCVNSVAHIYGNRPYDQSNNSKENFAIGVLSLGEGWHNYHHAFPWDYKASEFGRINATTTCLHFFAKIGWAYDFKSASDDLVKKVALKMGDGSHEKYGHFEEYEHVE